MKRRAFISLLGGAASWPLAARAQQSAMPVVGFLHPTSPGPNAELVDAFREGLRRAGYADGRNVAIEYRWAEGHYDQLTALAWDLVGRRVAVIAALGGHRTGLAAKAATSTVPIVFASGDDPVKLGLVASLNRPGGNATGVNMLLNEMEGKRLGLLHELIPTAATIAVLVDPEVPGAHLEEVQSTARALGLNLHLLNASSEQEIEAAFMSLARLRPGALLVASSAFFNFRRDQIVQLVGSQAVPAMYDQRQSAVAGGLISYGINVGDAYRQVGVYTGRILNGAKPADLPVLQPTRFELVLNLKTARALGLDVPDRLLALADEVID
jgi:putative tryptophan/tyrosine transport system substrate-binding protein